MRSLTSEEQDARDGSGVLKRGELHHCVGIPACAILPVDGKALQIGEKTRTDLINLCKDQSRLASDYAFEQTGWINTYKDLKMVAYRVFKQRCL